MTKLLFVFLAYSIVTVTYGQSSLDGTYVGLEKKCWTLKNGKIECYTDPLRPKRTWYNLTYIKIKGDSAFADQSPISIYKEDTLYSASDGGFYYYKGTITQTGSSMTIQLQFLTCDYCAIPSKANSNSYLFPWTKNYTCKITGQGLLINGFLFRRMNKEQALISERPSRTK